MSASRKQRLCTTLEYWAEPSNQKVEPVRISHKTNRILNPSKDIDMKRFTLAILAVLVLVLRVRAGRAQRCQTICERNHHWFHESIQSNLSSPRLSRKFWGIASLLLRSTNCSLFQRPWEAIRSTSSSTSPFLVRASQYD